MPNKRFFSTDPRTSDSASGGSVSAVVSQNGWRDSPLAFFKRWRTMVPSLLTFVVFSPSIPLPCPNSMRHGAAGSSRCGGEEPFVRGAPHGRRQDDQKGDGASSSGTG